MDITKYPGENITMYVSDATDIIREIKLNSKIDDKLEDLPGKVLQGLTKSAVPLVSLKAREMVLAANTINMTFFGRSNAYTPDPIDSLDEFDII